MGRQKIDIRGEIKWENWEQYDTDLLSFIKLLMLRKIESDSYRIQFPNGIPQTIFLKDIAKDFNRANCGLFDQAFSELSAANKIKIGETPSTTKVILQVNSGGD